MSDRDSTFPAFQVGDVVGKLTVKQVGSPDEVTGTQQVWATCSCLMSPVVRTTNRRILGGSNACSACLRARKISESSHVNITSASLLASNLTRERIVFHSEIYGRKRSRKYGKLVARRIKYIQYRAPCEVCVYWNDDCGTVPCVLKGHPVVWRPAIEENHEIIIPSVQGAILVDNMV